MIAYRREVDGLRALAVLPVILFHAGFQVFSGGFVGVDVFFVISGYLITSLILAEQRAGTFSLLRFYERRARRILPALFLVMFASLPLAWLYLSPNDLRRFAQSLVAVSVYASNILFWLTNNYFEPAAEFKPLLHTWSLAVEEQFYLLFPLLLMLTWTLSRRWLLTGLAFVGLVSLGAAHWGATARADATFYLLTTRAWELLIGVLVAFHLANEDRWQPGKTVSEAGGVAGLLLLACAIFLFDRDTPFPSAYALVPTLGTALIILFATPQTAVGKLLSWKPVVGIGLISYSAYLWHQPLFAFARHRNLEHPGAAVLGGLALAVLVLAYVSWRFVEAPFRDKNRVSRKQILAFGVACSAAFIAIGIAGTLTTGFMGRYQGRDRLLATTDTHEARQGLEHLVAKLSMKPFNPSDARPKVLVIGDSFGKDLLNSLQAGGLLDGMQVSFRAISANCGNLFVEPTEFRNEISVHRWPQCQREWIHGDERLRSLMLAADEIWFASSWRDWQTHYIRKSVDTTHAFSGKPVKVFGTKNFGKVRVQVFLSMPEESRLQFKGAVSHGAIEINRRIRESLPPDVFVDVQNLICGADPEQCNLFTHDGALITYDGGHLTRVGAEYFGRRLANCMALDRVLGAKSPPTPPRSCVPPPAT